MRATLLKAAMISSDREAMARDAQENARQWFRDYLSARFEWEAIGFSGYASQAVRFHRNAGEAYADARKIMGIDE